MDQQHLLYYVLLFIWLLPFTLAIGKVHVDILNTCLDGRNHKHIPGPESELFAQCKLWQERSCCTNATAKSLHDPMHLNFNFDHCSHIKPLSDECRKHFVQDTCFYECSPNVGPWLVKVNMKIRKERFYNVPLCKNDCSNWYEACKNDFTCNDNWIRGWNWTSLGNTCPINLKCQKFSDVFHNSTNFCQKIWDHSWEVVSDSKPCMQLWFDPKQGNPNDAVAEYYLKNNIPSSSVTNHKINRNYLMNIYWLYLGFLAFNTLIKQ